MYSKILVPMALDHDVSPQTLEIAKALGTSDCKIIALHVYEAPPSSVGVFFDDAAIKAGFDRAGEKLNEKLTGIPDVTGKIMAGHSARTIIDFADDNGIDCIVIGSHKPGLSDYFLGSTAARVVRHARCAVHVHRDG